MKKLYSAVLILLSISLFAQKGSIKGYVFDKASTEGVPFATVKVEGTDFSAATDDHGYFVIPNLKAGNYKLSVSYVGYGKQTIDIEVKKNKTKRVKFYLIAAIQLRSMSHNSYNLQSTL